MKPHLILTVDYEVFGNGQGCLQRCVVEPALRLLQVAEQHSAPITFFAEAAELMAMQREIGDVAVREVKSQLASAVAAGHDVQLHLHPQWTDARRRQDGGWNLDYGRWRIGDLAEEDTDALIATGKSWLDDVAFAKSPGRGCNAFRAGSWCIQPSERVVHSLKRHGFVVESTVVPGMRRSAPSEWSDFRVVPELPFWPVDGDVCVASNSGLWEVPIASGRVGRLEQLSAELQARDTVNSRFAPGCEGSYSIRTVGVLDRAAAHFRKLLDLGLAKLDFSTLPTETLVALTKDWTGRFSQYQPTPIVAIAHTKNWTERSSSHLTRYLTWAREAGIQFSTYSGWLESLGCDTTMAGLASSSAAVSHARGISASCEVR